MFDEVFGYNDEKLWIVANRSLIFYKLTLTQYCYQFWF